MTIDRNIDLTDEFRRLADQSAPAYEVDLGQIVATGRREKRRRRTARAGLTGLTALAALCGVAAAAVTFTQPSHRTDSLSPAGALSASSTTHLRSVKPTPPAGKSVGATSPAVYYRFPAGVDESSASELEAQLNSDGYTHVVLKSVYSSTVAPGNAIDVLNARGQSVLGQLVEVDTPLTVLVSAGPAQ